MFARYFGKTPEEYSGGIPERILGKVPETIIGEINEALRWGEFKKESYDFLKVI